MDGHSVRVDSRNARWRHYDKTLLCPGYKLPQESGFARAGLAREKNTRARVLYKVKGFISEIVNFAAVWSRVTTFSPPLY